MYLHESLLGRSRPSYLGQTWSKTLVLWCFCWSNKTCVCCFMLFFMWLYRIWQFILKLFIVMQCWYNSNIKRHCEQENFIIKRFDTLYNLLFKSYSLPNRGRNHTISLFSISLVYRFSTLENKIQLELGLGWPKQQEHHRCKRPVLFMFFQVIKKHYFLIFNFWIFKLLKF